MGTTPVGIFFFLPSLGGGSTTFTAHLFKAIQAAGYAPAILRVMERPRAQRQFGKYEGVYWMGITVEQAREWVRKGPTVMAAPGHSKHLVEPGLIKDLMQRGMRIVIHDPNEFKVYDHLGATLKQRPICIRPTMQRFYPKALWIPHPYMRSGHPADVKRSTHVISIARVASVKRSHLLLQANRLLPVKRRVVLRGAEFRLYTYNLQKRYPDVFKQSGKSWAFPMTFEASVRECAAAWYNVDLTKFPDDGGGTQYAQMEAMDAGCVNIMHQDWFDYPGEMKPGKHLLTVDGPEALVALLKAPVDKARHAAIVAAGHTLLKRHAPGVVGRQYMAELNR